MYRSAVGEADLFRRHRADGAVQPPHGLRFHDERVPLGPPAAQLRDERAAVVREDELGDGGEASRIDGEEPPDRDVHIFLEHLMKVRGGRLQAAEHIVQLERADGDVFRKVCRAAVDDGYADAARSDVGDERVALLRPVGELAENLAVDEGFLLIVLQYFDLQAVLNLELVDHERAVPRLAQGGRGDDAARVHAVLRCELRKAAQRRGDGTDALEADFSCGEHLVTYGNRIFKIFEVGDLSLAELGNAHSEKL